MQKGSVSLDQTVSRVIELFPATRAVFARHGLDTCCGGIHPIGMAARARGVDPDRLLAELNAAAKGS